MACSQLLLSYSQLGLGSPPNPQVGEVVSLRLLAGGGLATSSLPLPSSLGISLPYLATLASHLGWRRSWDASVRTGDVLRWRPGLLVCHVLTPPISFGIAACSITPKFLLLPQWVLLPGAQAWQRVILAALGISTLVNIGTVLSVSALTAGATASFAGAALFALMLLKNYFKVVQLEKKELQLSGMVA